MKTDQKEINKLEVFIAMMKYREKTNTNDLKKLLEIVKTTEKIITDLIEEGEINGSK